MRRSLISIVLAGSILSLGACDVSNGLDLTTQQFSSHTEIDALNETQAVGSPFTQHLTSEYRDFANIEQNSMFDFADALHFARKGIASAEGDAVMPEPISDWNLQPVQIDELRSGRARLINAFQRSSRELAPQESAIAQSRFDCWIEQEEENWDTPESVVCKNEFLSAMNALEAKLGNAPVPVEEVMAPVTDMPMGEAEPMAIEDAKYIVFFDFDSSSIEESGASVLDAVAAEVAKRNITSVSVSGHTDTSGADAYNKKLAERRAGNVATALQERGVAVDLINTKSSGESVLLVDTPDGVREPANRRVEISFE
jgi:OOP family OmpA-OmpF porin